jgi:outer membrane lipopolysaccharide assembly protein LptE/RlpB
MGETLSWARQARTQERLFLLALKRAKALDIGRGSLSTAVTITREVTWPQHAVLQSCQEEDDLIQHAKRFY